MKKIIAYHCGKENTSTVIDVAWETLAEGGIEALVVASARDETALALARAAVSVDMLSCLVTLSGGQGV